MDKSKENRIRAAGIVQSVIASGASEEDWVRMSKYGMRVSIYLAAVLGGKKPTVPVYKESE